MRHHCVEDEQPEWFEISRFTLKLKCHQNKPHFFIHYLASLSFIFFYLFFLSSFLIKNNCYGKSTFWSRLIENCYGIDAKIVIFLVGCCCIFPFLESFCFAIFGDYRTQKALYEIFVRIKGCLFEIILEIPPRVCNVPRQLPPKLHNFPMFLISIPALSGGGPQLINCSINWKTSAMIFQLFFCLFFQSPRCCFFIERISRCSFLVDGWLLLSIYFRSWFKFVKNNFFTLFSHRLRLLRLSAESGPF